MKNVRETVQKWKEVMELTASSVVKNEEWNAECQSVSFGDIQVQFCEPNGKRASTTIFEESWRISICSRI